MLFARNRLPYALGVLGLLFAAPAMAQGTAGAYSLQIPPGARAEGMGRSFTAIADDAFAPWWNPGGLAFLDGKNASLMHTKLVPDLADDVYFEYLSYAQHLSGWGGIAATITYLSYGESQATDPGQGDLGTFSSWEIAPSVAIGTTITDNLGIGANLKYVHLDLAPALSTTSGQAGKGSTFAVDIGALYRVPNAPINLAIVLQNLGPDIALVDEEQADPLPRMLRIGAAWQVVNKNAHSVILAVDGDKLLLGDEGGVAPDSTFNPTWFDDNEVLLNGGIEYSYNKLVSLRTGYIFDDPGEIKDFTFGLGVAYRALSFDYASIPQFEELDRVSKFSLSVRF
jgi:hypothetical protein